MVNFMEYFESKEEKYYDSKVLRIILESIYEKSFQNIKNDVLNANVTVTEDEIKKYLNEEEKHGIYDGLDKLIPTYEPYTLEYFKRYTGILKEKIATLLNIIESLNNQEIDSIKEELLDLDIILDDKNRLLKTDIIRLLKPTIFNINTFNDNIKKANTIETYLIFKISLDDIYIEGLTESEIYPNKSLQIKNLYYQHTPGNVDLSDNQVEKLKEKNKESMVYFLDRMKNK